MIKLSNAEIYGLIFLVFFVLFKMILHFIYGFDQTKSEIFYTNIYHIISDTSNSILLILAIYLIFFQGIKHYISFIILVLILTKSIIHFFSNYDIYSKIFTPNKKIEDKIEQLHTRASEIVDPMILVICLAILYKIYA